jgi:hypothetical protein
MKLRRNIVLTAAFITLLAFSGCKKETAAISDADFYKYISKALVDCYISIYNQNVAGYPVGAIDKTVNGPLGGSIHITGNTTGSGTSTSTDLLFSLTQVPYVYQNGNWKVTITLTGDVTYNGNFSGGYSSVNHQSSSLAVTGSVDYAGTSRSIDMVGNVSINRNSTRTSAIIFGHSVSY